MWLPASSAARVGVRNTDRHRGADPGAGQQVGSADAGVRQADWDVDRHDLNRACGFGRTDELFDSGGDDRARRPVLRQKHADPACTAGIDAQYPTASHRSTIPPTGERGKRHLHILPPPQDRTVASAAWTRIERSVWPPSDAVGRSGLHLQSNGPEPSARLGVYLRVVAPRQPVDSSKVD